MNDKKVMTSKMTMFMDAMGVIHIKYFAKSEMNIESAREEIQYINQMTSGKKAPCLVDITNVKSVTRGARLYYSSEAATNVIAAAALLINSQVSRILANFFLGINKPQMPVKLFNSEEQAVEWLSRFV